MWILLFIILVLCIFKKNITETFYGMNYIQQHNYLKCCNNLGCNHILCKKYLLANRKYRNAIGSLYAVNNNILFNKKKNKEIKLFVRYGKNQNHYYVKFLNKRNRYVHNRLLTKTALDNNSIVKLNNSRYRVHLDGNKNKYNPLYRNSYFKYEEPLYPVNLYANKYGYLKSHDLNSPKYLSLYRRTSGNNLWDYYVKKNNKIVKLHKYKNKILRNGDKLNFLDYDKTEYVYQSIN